MTFIYGYGTQLDMGRIPQVSVVMPVYNAERYLKESVGSILAQTFAHFELIIVDDASTDRSKEILRRVASADARIKLIESEKNGGHSAAVGRGLAAASGTWIARMDADDIAEPTRFEEQLKYLQAHSEVVLLGSNVTFIDRRSKPFGRDIDLPLSHQEIDASLMAEGWPIVEPTVFLRRDAVIRVGGWPEALRYNGDLDLFLRLGEVGQLINLPARLLRYRIHGTSLSAKQKENLVPGIVQQACERRGIRYVRRTEGWGAGIDYWRDYHANIAVRTLLVRALRAPAGSRIDSYWRLADAVKRKVISYL